MKNSKTIFTFFPNGQTVNSIKNLAKKEHKSNKYPSRSEALNAISKDITNLSYNAAVKEAKKLSPYLLNDTLYFPLIEENKTLYVTIKDNLVKIITSDEFDDELSFPFEHLRTIDVNNTKFKTIEKANNGWIYYLDKNEETEESTQLNIYKTDEGIVVDFVCIEEEGEGLSPITLLSTFAFWNEIFSEEEFEEIYC